MPPGHARRIRDATMDLRDIRYFSVLAGELHFGRAAARVGISTPGLSAAMKRLESECGGPLFERLPRGVHLTAAGLALREHAARLIALHDATVQAIAGVVGGAGAALRFGQILSVPEALTAPVLAELALRDPAAAYVMTRIPVLAARPSLLSRDVSVTLAVSTRLTYDRSVDLLEFAPLGEDPVVPIVRIGHPRLNAACTDDLALLSEEWVEFDPYSPYDEALDAIAIEMSGRARRATAVAPDSGMMFGLVSSSDRVGWCPVSFLPFVGDTVVPLPGMDAWRLERTLMLARRVDEHVPGWDELVSMLALRHRALVEPILRDLAVTAR